jgi:hypothetical protein
MSTCYVREAGYEVVDLINLAHNIAQYHNFVGKVNSLVILKIGEFDRQKNI